MGGGASAWTAATPGTPRQSSGGPQSALAGAPANGAETGLSTALWDNPVSRAVKGAFDPQVAAAHTQGPGTISPNDPLSLSHPAKPPSADLYVSMGLMAERSGNLEKANEFYDKAIKAEPGSADALLAYGHFHDRQGRLDVAVRFYQDAVRAEPQHAGAYNDLGLCYARQGQLPRALESVRYAAQLRPDREIYRNNVAKVLVEMDRGDEAVRELATLLPTAQAHYNVGWFFAQSGKQQQAEQHFTAALDMDPQMENARVWLTRLQSDGRSAVHASPAVQRFAHLPTSGAVPPARTTMLPQVNPTAADQETGYPLPVITNVRPVHVDEPPPTRVASLPQVAPGQPPASGSTAASPNWGASSSAASPNWTRPGTQPYTGPAASGSYPSSAPAASAPGGYPYNYESSAPPYSGHGSSSTQPFNGQSHESPWGTVPSPYRGAVNNGTLQYPTSLATAVRENSGASQGSSPSTVVNPYVTGASAERQAHVHQASPNALR